MKGKDQAGKTKSYPFDRSGTYRIRVKGVFAESSSENLGGLRITAGNLGNKESITELTGEIRDQAELSGILNKLYEMHMSLVSVVLLEDEE